MTMVLLHVGRGAGAGRDAGAGGDAVAAAGGASSVISAKRSGCTCGNGGGAGDGIFSSVIHPLERSIGDARIT